MTPIAKSQFKVSGLVWDRIFSNIVALIIFGICDAILSFILSAFVPVIGIMIVGIFNVCFGIGLLVGFIVWFIDLIAFCCSSLEVNETGLVGKAICLQRSTLHIPISTPSSWKRSVWLSRQTYLLTRRVQRLRL